MLSKEEQLETFLAKWANLPAQRSPQWYADRTFSIGASEMGTITGCNKYQKISQLIARHCGLEEITDRSAMNWGNVLEEIVNKLTEKVFECKIAETGSIPTEGIQYQRCSPDGVGVVKKLGNKLVSFEYKAPIRRIPNGEIPPYYESQVLSCLCAVVPSDMGIFVDCSIRQCSLADWSFDNMEFNTDVHRKHNFTEIEALAMLYIYRNDDTCDEGDEGDEGEEDVIDYGLTPKKQFYEFLKDCVEEKIFRVEYSDIFLPGETPTHSIPEGCVGIMPLKIMRYYIVPVKKNPNYVKSYEPIINKVIDIVKIVNELPMEERESAISIECARAGFE